MATILTKKRDTTGAPGAGDLTNSASGAELAVNTFDKRLYTKDSGGNVVELGINPTSVTTGNLTATGTTTIATAISGVLKAASGVVSAGTAGTDYVAPGTATTFTASQRGSVTTDNDGSFSMTAGNNFKCTPTGNFTLTFTNITAGQSGFILLVNSGGYTVSAHANTEVSATALATISAAGTYLLSYFSDGTNVFVVNSGALA
jgi:D-serine deaminase-like pyridoxal phosphate-dependent protein